MASLGLLVHAGARAGAGGGGPCVNASLCQGAAAIKAFIWCGALGTSCAIHWWKGAAACLQCGCSSVASLRVQDPNVLHDARVSHPCSLPVVCRFPGHRPDYPGFHGVILSNALVHGRCVFPTRAHVTTVSRLPENAAGPAPMRPAPAGPIVAILFAFIFAFSGVAMLALKFINYQKR